MEYLAICRLLEDREPVWPGLHGPPTRQVGQLGTCAGYEPHSALPMAIPMLLCPFSPARPEAFLDISTLTTSAVSLYSPPAASSLIFVLSRRNGNLELSFSGLRIYCEPPYVTQGAGDRPGGTSPPKKPLANFAQQELPYPQGRWLVAASS